MTKYPNYLPVSFISITITTTINHFDGHLHPKKNTTNCTVIESGSAF
jgi:hypothetical protein